MTRVGWAVVTVMVAAASGLGAQTPAVTLGSGSAAGVLSFGVWAGVGDRLSVGLEADADYRSWTRYLDGDRTRSGTDWRFAAGPSVRLDLARTGSVTLYGYGNAAWGRHRFASPVADEPDGTAAAEEVDPGLELALRPGIGADWAISERWSVGVLWAGRWLSGPESGPGLAIGERWIGPALGFTVRLRF